MSYGESWKALLLMSDNLIYSYIYTLYSSYDDMDMHMNRLRWKYRLSIYNTLT